MIEDKTEERSYCDELHRQANVESDKLLAGLRSIVNLVNNIGEDLNGNGRHVYGRKMAKQRGSSPA
jgi:hypothetical protein